jgi:hypothetical protein
MQRYSCLVTIRLHRSHEISAVRGYKMPLKCFPAISAQSLRITNEIKTEDFEPREILVRRRRTSAGVPTCQAKLNGGGASKAAGKALTC